MKSKTISTPTAQALSTAEAQTLLTDLQSAGYGVQVGKKEYAEIVGCTTHTIDKYIARGYGIPRYRKIGNQRNSRVMFALRDVAEYLSSLTIQTVIGGVS